MEIYLPLGFFVVAFLYASVGHGGASGYIALMTLAHFSPPEIRPLALMLNIGVSGIAAYQFIKSGHFSARILLPLIIASIPSAFLGGFIRLPLVYLKFILGIFLLTSAVYILLQPFLQNKQENEPFANPFSKIKLFTIGSGLGALSGLTGVGGGIFLSPVLLIFRQADVKTVAGISAVFILVNSMAGLIPQFITTFSIPQNFWIWMPLAWLGGFLGAYLGAKKINNMFIKVILAIILIVASWKMF